ncbi:hypothetical protein ACIA5A_03100 [Micromonospora sp. NPDC051300]|uniref:hypothetical protein n=1 Tax=Micromonospora sp. NPDC051300 TaxID=3364286 RepID=UPI0037954C9F
MRRLSPAGRKALLTAHLVTSLGWLGADLTLLALGLAGLRGADPEVVYPAAALLVTWLFAPLSVAVWLVGTASALLTPWGLLRWRWVLVKFALTTVMLGLVLLLLTPRIRHLGVLAGAADAHLRVDLVVAPAVSTTLLLIATVLSTHKPWGRIERDPVRPGGPRASRRGGRPGPGEPPEPGGTRSRAAARAR